MATYKAATLLFLTCFMCGTFANDVNLTSKVVHCYGNGAEDVVITLGGRVDPTSNNNWMAMNASTDGNGDSVFARSNTNTRVFMHHCNDAATGFCSWTATGASGKVDNKVMQILLNQNQPATGTISVTGSGRKSNEHDNSTHTTCVGADLTTPAIDPIIFKDQKSRSFCPPPSPWSPPPEKCPQDGAEDVVVTLGGHVDPASNNNGTTFSASTDGHDVAMFATSATNTSGFVRYYDGPDLGFCSWTATGASGKVYYNVMQILHNQTADGTTSVTAHGASGRKCDKCIQPIYYDANLECPAIDPMIFKEQKHLSFYPPPSPWSPPPEQCPQDGAEDVVVTLGGHVDPASNNNGTTFSASTDGHDVAMFATSATNTSGFVRYYDGPDLGFCSWTATGASCKVYYNVMQILHNQTADGTTSVTAHGASGRKCDKCIQPIYYDANLECPAIDPMIFKEQKHLSFYPPPSPWSPPPEQCPQDGAEDVVVTLGGHVDPASNNNGTTFSASTDGHDVAMFATSATNTSGFVRYYDGPDLGFCSWTATGASCKVYYNVMQILHKQTADGTTSVTAHGASGRKCDKCIQPIYYDANLESPAIDPTIFKEQKHLGFYPPPSPWSPPPEQCPQEYSFDVEVTRDTPQDNKSPLTLNKTVTGICSGNLTMNDKSVCPGDDINSTQPCRNGEDCGVCGVAQTSWYAAKQSGKCSKYGGQCSCCELQHGAACSPLPSRATKTWDDKQNRTSMLNDLGNMVDRRGKEGDCSPWKQGNWIGNNKMPTLASDWPSSRVLSWIHHGVPEWLGGHPPPRFYKAPLPASNAQQQWWLHTDEPRRMKLGVLTRLGLQPDFCSNAFCVPKGTAWHLGIEYKHINKLNVAYNFRYETMRHLQRYDFSNAFAVKADTADGFNQVPLHRNPVWYFPSAYAGGFSQVNSLPFFCDNLPYLTKITRPVVACLRAPKVTHVVPGSFCPTAPGSLGDVSFVGSKLSGLLA